MCSGIYLSDLKDCGSCAVKENAAKTMQVPEFKNQNYLSQMVTQQLSAAQFPKNYRGFMFDSDYEAAIKIYQEKFSAMKASESVIESLKQRIDKNKYSVSPEELKLATEDRKKKWDAVLRQSQALDRIKETKIKAWYGTTEKPGELKGVVGERGDRGLLCSLCWFFGTHSRGQAVDRFR
jgi:hypothetical protein